ncbi:peptidoglycan-binding domain-containing protein [Acetobacter sp.]|jgi:hypothetical protein|uniref:peptidoglycan-binding domain-containing protein n=1 Tax=Acetobacter sp. TaxID=440 RepID=UPI0025C5BD5A|nr:peptidoglycan-binding domain-containing protein [Acetobacter sp.]MCH4092642.1 peptidoglycan-binding protein [Acetobacter sp.]MCI1299776.1 peptidoglycan-binding protein [Acetobacter sp.]MCI1315344.1 peptidoglycan-binding protein [Acetobacter sp.]
MDFGIRRIGITAAALAVMASASPGQAQTAAPSPVFLMIGDDRSTESGVQLTACSENTHRLAQQLKQQGLNVFEVLNPSSVDLRVALTQFARYLDGKRPVISYCGYAPVQDGRVFLASDGKDTDLLSQSVPAVSLLRILDGRDGLVFLELHPLSGQSVDLSRAVRSLKGRMQNANALSVTLVDAASANPVVDGLASIMQPGWQWTNVTAFARGTMAATSASAPVSAAPAPMPVAPPPAPVVEQASPVEPAQPQPTARQDVPAKIIPIHDAPPTASVAAAGVGSQEVTQQVPAQGDMKEVAVPAQKPAEPPKPVLTKQQALKLARAKAALAAQAKAMRTVQVGLLAHGVYTGSVNGVKTRDTVNSIKKFQQSRNEPATGQLTATQLSALTGAGN